MPTKPRNFGPNSFYHIYNCGVERRQTFLDERDYQRFLDTVAYYLHDQTLSYAQFQDLSEGAKDTYRYLNPKGLETLRIRIVAYCLMPNHFHLLAKLVKEGGLTRFASDVANSYTKYFNAKNGRVGNLLQGTFKAKEITSDASLLQVSRYIHLNPPNPYAYPYSSYQEWINLGYSRIVDREELNKWLKVAGGIGKYKAFVNSKIGKNPALGIEDLVLE